MQEDDRRSLPTVSACSTRFLREGRCFARRIHVDYPLYVRIVKPNPKSRRGYNHRLVFVSNPLGENGSLFLFRP
jgi:hypothetical protein